MPLLKDLITIPERVHQGDFVLQLTKGVTEPEQTLRDYVVTPEQEDPAWRDDGGTGGTARAAESGLRPISVWKSRPRQRRL